MLTKVRILYFAAVRDLLGRDEETVELPGAVATVGDFTSWLAQARPALAGWMRQIRVARNEAFAGNEEPVTDGDVLALIPPVAGG